MRDLPVLLLPECTGINCAWCRQVNRYIRKDKQRTYRRLLMSLMVGFVVLANVWALRQVP